MGLTERVLELMNLQDAIESTKVTAENHLKNPKKAVKLPLGTPFYSTYHFQGIIGAVSLQNPSIRNWYLNESMSFCCERVFLYGFSSPHLNIKKSSWLDTPYFDKFIHPTRFLNEYVPHLICELIDHGYYVNFDGVDDYYLDGKSWYNKRHFCHDGLIYGYDHKSKTYDVYAYDSDWVYRGFQVSQSSFEQGRKAMMEYGIYGTICGVKPQDIQIEFDPQRVFENLNEYMESSLERYPLSGEGNIYGIAVHEYIAIYIDRLYHGLIQYDKMDWRIFRVVWEQKVFMYERLRKIEETLGFDSSLSDQYKEVVNQANVMRMLYASHRQKRRDSVLPCIKEKLLYVHDRERRILEDVLTKMELTIDRKQNR